MWMFKYKTGKQTHGPTPSIHPKEPKTGSQTFRVKVISNFTHQQPKGATEKRNM